MTTKRERRRGRERGAAGSAARRAARSRRAWLVPAIAGVIVLGTWLAVAVPRRPGRAPAPADPAASLDPQSALVRGVELDRAGDATRSIPYFRRAAETGSGWLVHWDYAAALNNASIQVRTWHGITLPASRSSIERGELVRHALDEVAEAERQLPDIRVRARMRVKRGLTLELWGFPIEALTAYHDALAMDPDCESAKKAEAKVLAELRGER